MRTGTAGVRLPDINRIYGKSCSYTQQYGREVNIEFSKFLFDLFCRIRCGNYHEKKTCITMYNIDALFRRHKIFDSN